MMVAHSNSNMSSSFICWDLVLNLSHQQANIAQGIHKCNSWMELVVVPWQMNTNLINVSWVWERVHCFNSLGLIGILKVSAHVKLDKMNLMKHLCINWISWHQGSTIGIQNLNISAIISWRI